MPFAYPVVVGMIEALASLCLVPSVRMLWLSLSGSSQLCYAVFWIVPAVMIVFFVGQVRP